MKPHSIDMYQPRARGDQVKVWRRMGGGGSVGGWVRGVGFFLGKGGFGRGMGWDLHSGFGVSGVSSEPSFGVLADAACWPRGFEVPLLPCSITCRMVCRGM